MKQLFILLFYYFIQKKINGLYTNISMCKNNTIFLQKKLLYINTIYYFCNSLKN